jgi:predicted acylesterase/phospholipase RssA
LFHLGVVKALRARTISKANALSKVTEIYAVSGGSIFAAHLVQNWSDYIHGNEKTFAKLEEAVLALAARDIRNRVLRRWLLTFYLGLGRAFWLQHEYSKLLGKDAIGKLNEPSGNSVRPELFLLATSFTTGEYCSFGAREITVAQRSPVKFVSTPCGNVPLTFAVAASSAFPPMFPPVTLAPQMLENIGDEYFKTNTYLSDGGVFDNIGLQMLYARNAQSPDHPAILVVSNAGASFQTKRVSFWSTISRNIRASDIMMRRVEDATIANIGSIPGARNVSISIRDTVPDMGLAVNVQEDLRMVRTDLDRFSPKLATLLVDHGCRAAWTALGAISEPSSPHPPLLASRYDAADLENVASRAGKRRWWPLVLGFRDWTTFPFVSAIALVIAFVSFGGWSVVNAHDASVKEGLLKEIGDVYSASPYDDEKRARLLRRASRKDPAAVDEPTAPASAPSPAVVRSGTGAVPAVTYAQLVYLQFIGPITRPQVANLNQALKAKNWRVQSNDGEEVEVAPRSNEVRFSGDNGLAAQALADAINATGIVKGRAVPKSVSIIGSNSLEVWLSN